MALRVVSSQSAEDVRRNQAQAEIEWPFRRLAANVLRIVRGAGKPEYLAAQMSECLVALEKYQKAVGTLPRPKEFRAFLSLQDTRFTSEDWKAARESRAERVLAMSGYPERLEAERSIHRGALQVAASRLVYQNTQEVIGEHEMYGGVHLLKESLVVSNFYWTRFRTVEIEEEPEPSTPDE